jgi:hypothetical protein
MRDIDDLLIPFQLELETPPNVLPLSRERHISDSNWPDAAAPLVGCSGA